MKRFYYLGDSKDFPSYPQDKDRHISLVSGYSLHDFLNKNKQVPFDLLILCGLTENKTLALWFEILSQELFLPPVVLLFGKTSSIKRFKEENSFLFTVLDRSIPVGHLWNELEKIAEMKDIKEKEIGGALFQSGKYGLIGTSKVLVEIRNKISKYAKNELSVLILGESGTGKELIAQALHREGHGSGSPFEAYQVSPVNEELFESNLFGVKKGAFTGSENRLGLMELAKGGVLFLDEIGTLSAGNQISLLRVLEERSIRPLGSEREIATDFRLISATNENLLSHVDRGQFRSDLFHRISTLVINVPPLRDRKEDIILLAESFIDKEKTKKVLTKHAEHKLTIHDWPGNIRELLNTVRRAYVESGSRNTIEARDILLL